MVNKPGDADTAGTDASSNQPGSGAANNPSGAGIPGAPKRPAAPAGAGVGDKIQIIEGKDLDGVEFSLEDYQGKVMMIDFWGDW
jgi:hypothetical protein